MTTNTGQAAITPATAETHLILGGNSYGVGSTAAVAKKGFVKNFGNLSQPYLHYIFSHDKGVDINLRVTEFGEPVWQGFLAAADCWRVNGNHRELISHYNRRVPMNAEEEALYRELVQQ